MLFFWFCSFMWYKNIFFWGVYFKILLYYIKLLDLSSDLHNISTTFYHTLPKASFIFISIFFFLIFDSLKSFYDKYDYYCNIIIFMLLFFCVTILLFYHYSLSYYYPSFIIILFLLLLLLLFSFYFCSYPKKFFFSFQILINRIVACDLLKVKFVIV